MPAGDGALCHGSKHTPHPGPEEAIGETGQKQKSCGPFAAPTPTRGASGELPQQPVRPADLLSLRDNIAANAFLPSTFHTEGVMGPEIDENYVGEETLDKWF